MSLKVLEITLGVTHVADAPLGLNGGHVQRCAYCGELLWDSFMRGRRDEPYRTGGMVVFEAVAERGAQARAPLFLRVFEVPDVSEIAPACYSLVVDNEGRELLPPQNRAVRCVPCREGLTPKLLDRDGVVWGVSGEPAVWGHAHEDKWWPCAGAVRRA